MSLTIYQAQRLWEASAPLTIACQDQGKHYGSPRVRAESWCYITAYQRGGVVFAAPQGSRRAGDPVQWRRAGTVADGYTRSLDSEHARGEAESLSYWLSIATVGTPINAYRPDGWLLLRPTRCARCSLLLTTPRSILDGVGPVCSGREQEARARSEAKRTLARSISIHEMRKRITGAQ